MWENKETGGFVTKLIRHSYPDRTPMCLRYSMVNPDSKSLGFNKLLKWQFCKNNSLPSSLSVQIHRWDLKARLSDDLISSFNWIRTKPTSKMSSCDSVCASDYSPVESAMKGSLSWRFPSQLTYNISVVPRPFLLKVHLFISRNIYQEWFPNARLCANTWSLLSRGSQFSRKGNIFKNKLLWQDSKPH